LNLENQKLSTEIAAQQSRLAEQSLQEDGKLSRRVLEIQAGTSLADKELAWRTQEVESNERMFQQNLALEETKRTAETKLGKEAISAQV